ncbi:tat twin-arginine translocation pathway signal sequence domain protein [Asticcacaulis biprosthecium C19]|uniref:Tat twin-arginine translocation pathway signal sequence domain protein n=1 Tax=Asticcacaulis biprosthecium C19 TaxID=715226 RepID=F4QKU1_9CAUL|nr:DUF1501 domain-containing protein [Asticcacaulis biprosthecium]EGF93393.1 tat twin-arginine translocation pathway signal sequence domain protein [Asticcacaulis biprosthecium C19]
MLNRRSFLTVTGTAAFGAFIPRVASAAGARDPRFITIILRGALDGLAAVPPVGDPGYERLRQAFAITSPLKLDGMFALHPSLTNLARQYRASHATVIHASATPYRARSHFDGQDVLESGYSIPGHTKTGWLNRLLKVLPATQRAGGTGLAVGTVPPLVMRGSAEVMGWAPSSLSLRDDNLPPRILAMYQDTDPALARAFDTALATDRLAGETTGEASGQYSGKYPMTGMATGAARLLARDDGPRVAALAFNGWDTHTRESKKLAELLTDLDGALAAFETELGPKWKDTVILVATEFGRTAAINGTQGTDHGQATAAFLVGGGVKGGRVITDWPGLGQAKLYEGRDLMPTTDLRAVIKGSLTELYDLSPSVLASDIFPDSAAVKPATGWIA